MLACSIERTVDPLSARSVQSPATGRAIITSVTSVRGSLTNTSRLRTIFAAACGEVNVVPSGAVSSTAGGFCPPLAFNTSAVSPCGTLIVNTPAADSRADFAARYGPTSHESPISWTGLPHRRPAPARTRQWRNTPWTLHGAYHAQSES